MILETAFKKETIGLVTREQYVEKRVNIRNKIEEEEKEKLQKMQQEEEELQMQKRKKRRVKGDSRLSFFDEIDNGSDEEDMENNKIRKRRRRRGRRRRREKYLVHCTSLVPLRGPSLVGRLYDSSPMGEGSSTGDSFSLRREKDRGDQHSFYELIINKARGKSGPVMLMLTITALFHFDVHEDVRTIADATIEKDEVQYTFLLPHLTTIETLVILMKMFIMNLQSHAGKVVERHWYEKNKHIFPASRWEVCLFVQLISCAH
ncbi:hypothetical protein GW17_00024772 [Ensete ventricosum]|nr:hypothetical protein GW17_00024772 [Ensete ventricosum]